VSVLLPACCATDFWRIQRLAGIVLFLLLRLGTNMRETAIMISRMRGTGFGLVLVVGIVGAVSFGANAQAVLSAGFDDIFDLADSGWPAAIVLPPGKTASNLVAMGVGPDDTGYFWWSDGTLSEGSADSTYQYRSPRPYSLAAGQQPGNIVGIAVDYTGDVYTYYLDGTVSIGTPYDLDAIDSDVLYALRRGYTPRDIVGVAMMDEDVMLFMRDGTFHISDIDDYDEFTNSASNYQSERYTIPSGWTSNHILGMDFADTNGLLFCVYSTNRSLNRAPTATTNSLRRILDRDRTRRRKQRTTGTTRQVQPQEDGVDVGPGGITLRKDGFSLTLPSAPKP